MKRIAIVMMAALGLAAAGAAQANEELAKKSGCTTCHNVTGAKKMGPSLKDAGAKGEAAVLTALNDKKKHASVKASDDDKKALAKWMASMK
jgi:cytochrome c551/c552